MDDQLPDTGRFAAAFMDFVQAMTAAVERPESELAVMIREHLGADPKELPITVAQFASTEHPNLQLALDSVLADAEVLGYTARHAGFVEMGLADLLAGQGMAGPIKPGPVQYTDIAVGDGRVIQCVSAGIYLAQRDGVPLALVLSTSERPFGGSGLKLQGISPEKGAIAALIGDLRAAMRAHNVYRGRVISLHQHEDQSVTVQFHTITEVAREAVILPDGTLERLERHAIEIAKRAEQLRADGRHLKRGVLLHGPPGTGKTLAVTYLLGAMPGRTTVLLTGRGLGLIEEALQIARELAPATVVFEDVDLVAAERTMPLGNHGILFELLTQMEGLAEDADLLFLLTTNRPDVIEPALAARPGRIDLALEFPLPDEAARRRLLRLYASEIPLDEDSERDLATRTEGVTGAFIKELMRQAALTAALGDRKATAADVAAALERLLDERSALTRRLLGQPADGAPPGVPPNAPFPQMLHAFGAAGLAMPEGFMEFGPE